MEKYNVSLIGVNLVENENVYLGAILRVNSVRSVVIIAKESEYFTNDVNNLLSEMRTSLNKVKKAVDFNAMLTKSKVKMLMYNVVMNVQQDNAALDLVVSFLKKRYFKVINNLEAFDMTDGSIIEEPSTKSKKKKSE